MKSTLRIYLMLIAMRSLTGGLIGAIYVKYLLMNGLNMLETSLLNCTFYAGLILLDIPTGAFADVFGRKKSVMMSFAFAAVAEAIYGSSSTAVGFVIAEIMMALSSTLINGALQAWVVDQMKFYGHVGSNAGMFGNATIVSSCVAVPSAIVGGLLFAMDSSFPWFACSALMVAGLIFTMVYMEEGYFVRKNVSLRRSYKMMCITVRVSFRYMKQNRVVRFIILSSIIQSFATQAPNMQWTPQFEGVLGGSHMLGFAMASFSLMGALGGFLAKRMLEYTRNEERLILYCQVAMGVLIVASGLVPGPIGFFLFLLHQIPRGMYGPVKEAYFQDHITSRERATMSSFGSIVPNTGGIIALFSTGLIANIYGIPLTWAVSGAILVVVAVSIAVFFRKD